MKTNLYFSFIGSAFGKKLLNLEDLSPNTVKTCGELLHSNYPSTDLVEIYEVVERPNLVYVVRNGYQNEIEWFQWFLCRRDSFDCLPAVPPIGLEEKLHEAFK